MRAWNRPGIDTEQSKGVIDKRKHMEELAYATKIAFHNVAANISRVEEEIKNVKENATIINANKNYIDTTIRKAYKEVLFDGNVTKCINCAGLPEKGLGNCHLGCSFAND